MRVHYNIAQFEIINYSGFITIENRCDLLNLKLIETIQLENGNNTVRSYVNNTNIYIQIKTSKRQT